MKFIKFLLRIMGTWFLGIAVVFLIRDIILSQNLGAISFLSFSQTWNDLHSSSWLAISNFLSNLSWPNTLNDISLFIISLPAWVVLGVLGTIMLFVGRKKSGNNTIEIN
ncbi:MAG: hypothetical protein L3J15_08460 [Devosiaceae bacterium]|nr:hypothetical protein [Devosiaceae bacterium]